MTSFLLDTHTFIWLTENDPNLPNNLREEIDFAPEVYVSIVSLWEIAIKLNLGKLALQKSYETIETKLEASDITLLSISFSDTLKICTLPLHHRDPFDRMLISQAKSNKMIIITDDNLIQNYNIETISK
jgi:PIN domain nuclease of toxin-antitoxin system